VRPTPRRTVIAMTRRVVGSRVTTVPRNHCGRANVELIGRGCADFGVVVGREEWEGVGVTRAGALAVAVGFAWRPPRSLPLGSPGPYVTICSAGGRG